MSEKSYYLCYQNYSGPAVIDVRQKLAATSRRGARKEAFELIEKIRDEKTRTGDEFSLEEEIVLFHKYKDP